MTRRAIIAALLLGCANVAVAQDSRPPVEVGAGVDGLLVTQYEDFTIGDRDLQAHIRLGVPFTPRFAVESLVTVGRHIDGYAQRTEGLYIFQVRQRLRGTTRERFHAFLTYGAGGYWARVHQPGLQVVEPTRTMILREFSYNETDAPLAGLFGIGFQRQFRRQLALRMDAQLVTLLWIPVGMRVTAGASVPIR